MTEKHFCKNCKHTRGIGYDFWCDEGHTKYEVFGAETNCPYYEYHDWSKGTPNRTKKRFTYKSMCLYDEGVLFARAKTLVDADIICKRLNKMNEENLELKEYSKELLIYINNDCPKSKRRLKVD